MTIWELITQIVLAFRPVCTRPEPFAWLVVAILGIMCRSDSYGSASSIRSMEIDGRHYGAFLNFFRSTAISLPDLRKVWCKVLFKFAMPYKEGNSCVGLIDHTKKSKEGRKSPGVKRHTQESETQSKAKHIFGYLFGGLSIVIGCATKADVLIAIPLILQLQCGIKCIKEWSEDDYSSLCPNDQNIVKKLNKIVKDLEISTESYITQMVLLAINVAEWAEINLIIVADRAFLTIKCVSAIQLHNLSPKGKYKVQIVTRARNNTVAYPCCPSTLSTAKRNAAKRHLSQMFDMDTRTLRRYIGSHDKSIVWRRKDLNMYGKTEDVHFVAVDLYWKEGIKLRFVFVKYGDKKTILVSTDCSLDAEAIIRLYCCREKIECNFRELNQVVNAFSSRFWSPSMPKLNRFSKSTDPDPLEKITDRKERLHIASCVRAIQIYAAIACISLGIMQIISVSFVWSSDDFRWQRTPTSIDRPSEACIQEYLQGRIMFKMIRNPQNEIGALLKKWLAKPTEEKDDKTMAS